MRMNFTFTSADLAAGRAFRRIGAVLGIYLGVTVVAFALAALGRAG